MLGFVWAAWLAVAPTALAGQDTTAAAEIVFLDVGQGDAVLIRSPEGRTALVDAGPRDADVAGQLRRRGVDSLNLVVATHPHADHIGGLAAVLRAFPVRYYMDNGAPHTTRTYRELLQAVRAADVVYLEAVPRRIRLGSVAIEVLPPPAEAEDHNARSLGLQVRYGEFDALLTGDAPLPTLNHFLALGVGEVELLKASHHGSRDGVSPGWLSRTKPEVVVISCGGDNPYGHPDRWALRYYEAVARVYRTDRDGEVRVSARADGSYRVGTAGGGVQPGTP